MVYGNEARPEGPALGPRVPAPRYHIPYTILPFTIYNLPCTIYHLLSTIYYLPFTIYHLLFTIYYLPFTIYHLLFTIYYLPFTIYPLLFIIYQPPVNKVRFWHKRFGSKSFKNTKEPVNKQISRGSQTGGEGGVPLLTEGAGYYQIEKSSKYDKYMKNMWFREYL